MTLIESLVALVILALGVLGLIGFQLQTLKDTRESVGRSRALVAIQDITERMRLNQTSAATYVTPGFGAVAAPPVNCIGTPCNTAQLAAFDLARWRSNVAQALPGGQGAIARSPGDPRQFMVMLAWRENQTDANAATVLGDANRTDPFQNANQTLLIDGGLNTVVCPPTFTCHRAYVQPFN